MNNNHERIQSKLKSDLGPIINKALEDPNVIDIMLNDDGALWVDTFDGMKEVGYMESDIAKNLINTIASMSGVYVTRENPDIASEIWLKGEEGLSLYRFQGEIPPIVINPTFTIRKQASRVFTIEDQIKCGLITQEHGEILKKAIIQKKSILVVGGTQSGKTTFLNSLIDCLSKLSPNERVAIIEDTRELKCELKNKSRFKVSENRDMDDLLRNCMRSRPDRIIVGEVRGKEAYSLIKSWNTGHPGGFSTIHANSAKSGLLRLEQLISEAGVPPTPEGIAEAVNLVVFIEKSNACKCGRKIKEILALNNFDKEKGYAFQVIS